MKTILVVVFMSLPFLAFLCEESKKDTVVGSNNDVAISGLVFTVERAYVSGVTMYANGTVRNSSSGRITSPWFVEGQFYTDSTYALKLGGANIQINVPLDRGQGTLWSLSFTPSQSAQNYPYFRVGDLRGIYKK